MSLAIYYPFIRDYIREGYVFSGSGDGFRQMMPFQLYLYEHFTQFKGFYDQSFGLGGDYVKGLAYYYSLSLLYGLISSLFGLEILYLIGTPMKLIFGHLTN